MDTNRYLGDGVYVSFDGWQMWLAVNNHHNRVVALEPAVFAALIEYGKDLREYIQKGIDSDESKSTSTGTDAAD